MIDNSLSQGNFLFPPQIAALCSTCISYHVAIAHLLEAWTSGHVSMVVHCVPNEQPKQADLGISMDLYLHISGLLQEDDGFRAALQ